MPHDRHGMTTIDDLVRRLVLYTHWLLPAGSDPHGDTACQYVVEAWEELSGEQEIVFSDDFDLFELLCAIIRRHVEADVLPESAM